MLNFFLWVIIVASCIRDRFVFQTACKRFQNIVNVEALLVQELVPFSKENMNFTPDTMSPPIGESLDITGKHLGH